MNITLYQMIPELDDNRLLFEPLNAIRVTFGNTFPAELYEIVFEGDVEAENAEKVFEIFNIALPSGYRGRSMSISDVLEIKNDNGSEFLYCNPFGFKTIKFDKEKAMKPIVNHDFQRVNITRINKRVYFFDENDILHELHCDHITLLRCRYDDNLLGYEIQYTPFGEYHFKSVKFLHKPLVVITDFLDKLPNDLIYEYDGHEKKLKHPNDAIRNLGLISTWINKSGYKFENL